MVVGFDIPVSDDDIDRCAVELQNRQKKQPKRQTLCAPNYAGCIHIDIDALSLTNGNIIGMQYINYKALNVADACNHARDTRIQPCRFRSRHRVGCQHVRKRHEVRRPMPQVAGNRRMMPHAQTQISSSAQLTQTICSKDGSFYTILVALMFFQLLPSLEPAMCAHAQHARCTAIFLQNQHSGEALKMSDSVVRRGKGQRIHFGSLNA
jgi:hypothetical protein